MKNFYKNSLAAVLLMVLTASVGFAQTNISGKITDEVSGEPIAGVNIVVKGRVIGTISGTDGNFSLKVNDAPPMTLTFSFVGYATKELEITEASTTGIDMKMSEQTILGQEVVVSASRMEESILSSPVTIEKIGLLEIKQSATPDFYDGLSNLKGVSTNSGSLNLTSVNTRGFATIANTRFVQWVDGMDTQAPLLNFPTGSIMGLGELDAESMELIPGAASALYGPNAFNGILVMQSKSPFEYQGLSAQVKQGVTTSDAGGTHPLGQYSIRYAKAFNNKFAFKVNFSYMTATDWLGNDYKTERNNPESTVDLGSNPNFDGLNTYGDETPIPVPIGGTFGTLDLRRTGLKEEDLLGVFSDNRDAKTIKGDAAIHYRITDKLEILYNYRYGGGSSIYQGTEKYVLRGFNQQFHKLELKGDNFFVRGYISATDAGDSYNLSALGGYTNEALRDTKTIWAPTYAQTYVLATQGYWPGVPAGDAAAAHAAARLEADKGLPAPGTDAYNTAVLDIRSKFFQRTPPGASFFDNSKLLHGEFNYKFFDMIKWAEIQIGGNFRQYNLFSDGTIFNEAPDDGLDFKRIKINEGGAYAQIAKTFAEALKITGSVRYDKNENFDGQFTPRVSAVYTFNQNQNIRASFQTGFRNPDTQAQFIYFPSSSGTLVGSTKANAERYGIHEGGAWTEQSIKDFRGTGGSFDANGPVGGDPSKLKIVDLDYVQPEQLKSVELGYKGLIASKLLVDLNGYYTVYSNFIGGEIVGNVNATSHQGVAINPGTLFSPYTNSKEDVKSYGVGLGLTYSLPRNFVLNGSWNYANFETSEANSFRSGFNTPKNKFTVGLGNRKIAKNLGFNVTYRWQTHFEWSSTYGVWNVPEYGVVDAQINYKLTAIKTMLKVGGTNIGGGDYRTNLGSPFIGQQYYISLTFDEFFN